jgi:hypothetical protein
MILARWLKAGGDRAAAGEPICELRIDGETQTLTNGDDEGLTWGIYWHYVDEGQEVGPTGALFEYSYDGRVLARPPNFRPGPRRLPYRRRQEYPSVFLNYRRDDSDAYAGRLHETLVRELGTPEEVFMDQFSVKPGEPFPWAIQQAVAHCDVMVALIGPKWLSVADRNGRRRLDDPRDYVRREITAGLDRGISLIPVILPGGSIPDASALPEEMQGLEQLQMLDLSARHWQADVGLLIGTIREELR